MINEIYLWIGFAIIVIALLALDLGVFQRKAHSAGMKEAIRMTIFYVVVSLMFAAIIAVTMNYDKSFEFLTTYITEKALSVDNLFVFSIIFTYFGVSLKYQHRVLFWGIIGALVMRGVFIFAGVELISRLHFILYLLGAFLVYTAFKLMTSDDNEEIDPSKNIVMTRLKKYLPVKEDYVGGNFFVKGNPGLYVTPLLIVLLVIETSDIAFATDSVPAVLSITQDAFIVYTSNIFAILGLRALYFVIIEAIKELAYLKYGISIVLAFIGIKMLISDFIKIPIAVSLVIVAGLLLSTAAASVIWKKEEKNEVEAGN